MFRIFGFLFDEFFGWLFDLLIEAIFESERAVGMVAGGLGGLTIMGTGFLLEYFSGYKQTLLSEIASLMYCIFPGNIVFALPHLSRRLALPWRWLA